MTETVVAVIRARLNLPDVEAFIRAFAPLVSPGGMFVRTKQLKEPGTTIRFDFSLKSGERLLLGEGIVRQVREGGGSSPAGMLVKFTKLNRASKELIDRIVAFKARPATAEQIPQAPSEPTPTPEPVPEPVPEPEPPLQRPPSAPASLSGRLTNTGDVLSALSLAEQRSMDQEEVPPPGLPLDQPEPPAEDSAEKDDAPGGFSFGLDEDEVDSVLGNLFGGDSADVPGLDAASEDGAFSADGPPSRLPEAFHSLEGQEEAPAGLSMPEAPTPRRHVQMDMGTNHGTPTSADVSMDESDDGGHAAPRRHSAGRIEHTDHGSPLYDANARINFLEDEIDSSPHESSGEDTPIPPEFTSVPDRSPIDHENEPPALLSEMEHREEDFEAPIDEPPAEADFDPFGMSQDDGGYDEPESDPIPEPEIEPEIEAPSQAESVAFLDPSMDSEVPIEQDEADYIDEAHHEEPIEDPYADDEALVLESDADDAVDAEGLAVEAPVDPSERDVSADIESVEYDEDDEENPAVLGRITLSRRTAASVAEEAALIPEEAPTSIDFGADDEDDEEDDDFEPMIPSSIQRADKAVFLREPSVAPEEDGSADDFLPDIEDEEDEEDEADNRPRPSSFELPTMQPDKLTEPRRDIPSVGELGNLLSEIQGRSEDAETPRSLPGDLKLATGNPLAEAVASEEEDVPSLDGLLSAARQELAHNQPDESDDQPADALLDEVLGDAGKITRPESPQPGFDVPTPAESDLLEMGKKRKKGFFSRLFGGDN